MKCLSVLTVVAALAALLGAAAMPANAAGKPRPPAHYPRLASRAYDGLWSVSVLTQAGPCDPSYRYPARIVGGRIVQADNDFSYQISGAVISSGGIAVTISRGGQSAVGYGKLRGTSGGGHWTAGGNACYGTWTAMKRASN